MSDSDRAGRTADRTGTLHPNPNPNPGTGTGTGTRASAFGLDVHSEIPLLFLEGSSETDLTGRGLEISEQSGDMANLGWPEPAELVCDQRQPDGSVIFRIEAHPDAGYLITGPEYGAHLLSADGRRLRCAPEGRPDGAWQRLLIAQVLPFAALLQGLEVLHASAVVIDRAAVAFIGPSGSGKTSVALELCRRGASFLADDVLALEPAGDQLLGHPGAPVAGLDHAEARRLARAGGAEQEEIVMSNARERLVRMRCAKPTPIAALFFLDRLPQGPGTPCFEPATDPKSLLAATFNTVITTPSRLRGLLDVCTLATDRRMEQIAIGPDVDASQLGAAVERRLCATT